MNLGKQKKLAARTLGVSTKRIKLNLSTPENKKELKELISREAVKELVSEKIIVKLPKKGNSRTRANMIMSQKKKGRRSGAGARRGTANARFNEKDKWIIKIRALRDTLKEYKDAGRLESASYRDLYKKAKGNFFRNKRHMILFISQNSLLSEVKKTKKWKIKIKTEFLDLIEELED